jgi:hypothetical protein
VLDAVLRGAHEQHAQARRQLRSRASSDVEAGSVCGCTATTAASGTQPSSSRSRSGRTRRSTTAHVPVGQRRPDEDLRQRSLG